jgi:hypothetical protein
MVQVLKKYIWRVAKLLVPAFCILNTPLISRCLNILLFPVHLFIVNFNLKLNLIINIIYLHAVLFVLIYLSLDVCRLSVTFSHLNLLL